MWTPREPVVIGVAHENRPGGEVGRYSASVGLRDRGWREDPQSPGNDVTGRLRDDFWNRLSRRSEEKFGNFLGANLPVGQH